MSTALYRRYRPETFADVIGQEHVTEPLMQALRSGRVNHAYLFSGPRGCGKTTSARILARCLNCEQGPTPDPCGECEACVALARGGPGSVDVIEIDAASHGGVDDARDLRERAAFGPAQARYKVYIIDEAHMVTSHGFNALLKVVEEPPEHVKFIFATTEPDKVLSTIRSRTHHYPFHLVPPQRLTSYLEELCVAEGVQLEPGVLSFVTRAGGGSVRDSLSVLDQLIAGAGDRGLTYEGAAALLGFTDVELLDSVVDAVGAQDAAAVFRQVDRVMESGHDPRRFVEDLLERYRDLIVVSAVGDRAGALLRGMPEDQVDRLRHQAGAYGPATLTRCADVVSRGLSEMTGAVSYRLHLELICARLLLPAADGAEGHAARLDRIERRLAAGPGGTAEPAVPGNGTAGATPTRPAPTRPAPEQPAPQQPTAQQRAPERGAPEQQAPEEPASPVAQREDAEQVPARQDPEQRRAPEGAPQRAQPPGPGPQGTSASGRPRFSPPPTAAEPAATPPPGEQRPSQQQPGRGPAPDGAAQDGPAPDGPPPAAPGSLDTDAVRRSWPEVLERIKGIRRVTWTLVSVNSTVLDYDGRRVLLGLSSEGLAQTFSQGVHAEVVRQGLLEAIGLDARVEGTAAGAAGGRGVAGAAAPAGAGPAVHGAGSAGRQQPAPADEGRPGPDAPGPDVAGPATESTGGPSAAEQLGAAPRATPVDRGGVAPPAQEWAETARSEPPAWATGQGDPEPASEQSRAATAARPPGGATGQDPGAGETAPEAPSRVEVPGGDVPRDDDEDLESSGAVGPGVIENVLGGTVIAVDDEPTH